MYLNDASFRLLDRNIHTPEHSVHYGSQLTNLTIPQIHLNQILLEWNSDPNVWQSHFYWGKGKQKNKQEIRQQHPISSSAPIWFSPPPHRLLLQLHPGPSLHSFSWHGQDVLLRTESAGRSRCASDCPDAPQTTGYSPPAYAHYTHTVHNVKNHCGYTLQSWFSEYLRIMTNRQTTGSQPLNKWTPPVQTGTSAVQNSVTT